MLVTPQPTNINMVREYTQNKQRQYKNRKSSIFKIKTAIEFADSKFQVAVDEA